MQLSHYQWQEAQSIHFTFGLNKAKAILEFLDDIKKFVEENQKPEP